MNNVLWLIGSLKQVKQEGLPAALSQPATMARKHFKQETIAPSTLETWCWYVEQDAGPALLYGLQILLAITEQLCSPTRNSWSPHHFDKFI